MFRITHKSVFIAFALAMTLTAVGSWLTSLRVRELGLALTVMGVLFGIFSPLPAYWHQKGDSLRRDSALLIPLAFLLYFFIPIPFLIGARLGLPLQDERFAKIDQHLGVSIGAVVSWTQRHQLVHISNAVYNSLFLFMLAAVLVPALVGKREGARFLLANVLAFMIGIPCCALLPAIGPWYAEHFAVGRSQLGVQEQVLALRAASPYAFSILSDGAGIVAFPSFHVIWAILSASSLWWLRKLRVVLALWSALIVISTMTTGFHYFVDVLAGGAVAAAALLTAQKVLRSTNAPTVQALHGNSGGLANRWN